MSGYYLCRTECAVRPFYIESIGRNIYSLEELCYYFSHYVYLIDEAVVNVSLCRWIGTELGLVKLQNRLLRALERETYAEFLTPIFQECGYLDKQEFRLFQEQFTEILTEPEEVRRKMKADYLVEFGRYVIALREYEKITQQQKNGKMGMQFYAAVLENMAAAYAHLFEFEEAADCLWNSYQVMKSKKVYEKYLRILPLFLSEKQYQQRLTQIRADRSDAMELWEDTRALIQEGMELTEKEKAQKEGAEKEIQSRKDEYLRNTAFGM